VLAIFSALLFGFFVIGGGVALVLSWQQTSCSGMPPETAGDTVELVGPGGVSANPSGGTLTWTSIPVGDCVELTTSNGSGGYQGTDLGVAPTIHEGQTWTIIRAGEGAWIAWTFAMFLLAAAVAAIPAMPRTVEGAPKNTDRTGDVAGSVQ
jgi:hypothetical protein